MDWTKLFDEAVLHRGFGYFCADAVGPLTVSDGVLFATVRGSEEYRVRLPLDEDRAGEFSCTCAFAQSGHRCKHMAAALYAWDAQGRPRGANRPGMTPARVREMVGEADEVLVRSYLTAVLMENKKLADQFYDLWTMWQAGMPGSDGPMQ